MQLVSIKSRFAFKTLGKSGAYQHGKTVVIKSLPLNTVIGSQYSTESSLSTLYFGITIAKRHIKSAVKRNRVRRRLKEILRHNTLLPTEYAYLIIVKCDIANLPFHQLRDDCDLAFKLLKRRLQAPTKTNKN